MIALHTDRVKGATFFAAVWTGQGSAALAEWK